VPAYRQFLDCVLDSGAFPGRGAIIYRCFVAFFVVLVIVVDVARTVSGFDLAQGVVALAVDTAAELVLLFDLFLQACGAVVRRAPGCGVGRALRRYLLSPYGLIDVMAILPFCLALALPSLVDLRTALGILRFLKFARYSPALETLGSVVRREARILQAAGFIMAMIMLGTSTTLYLVERSANPNFASIPDAMWWSVATLTTVGYGDLVPVTPLGKFLGSIVAILGVGMFALPASIMATGFAEEIKRRDFLATWRMVAKVPFFNGLDANQIASITALLKYVVAAPGDVLIKVGDIGEEMYFIVSGQVAIELSGGRHTILSDGDFFGEIALLHRSPRTATVRAQTRCQLLVLDAQDFRRFIAGSPSIGEVLAKTAKHRLEGLSELAD
jgi:voltage-gated potassium channel